MILAKIYSHIPNNKLLNIQSKEEKLLDNLVVKSLEDENINKSRNLVFLYKSKEDEYDKVKDTIITYFFLKNITLLYLDEAISNYKVDFKPEITYKDIVKKIDHNKTTSNKSYLEITNDCIFIKGSIDYQINEFNINEGDFKELYNYIKNKDIEKFIFLIELFNYVNISINSKIKFLNLIIILESLAKFNNKCDETKPAFIRISRHLKEQNIENDLIKDDIAKEIHILCAMRNSLVHHGSFDDIGLSVSSKYINNEKKFSKMLNKLTKLTLDTLKNDILTFIGLNSKRKSLKF